MSVDMPTKVVNLHKEPYDVYIGRPGRGQEGKWGNPFSSYKNGITVKESIDKFEEYLLNNIELMTDIHELKGKTLGCFCKPGPCHGDVLAKYADKQD
jgi:hypothetical protein